MESGWIVAITSIATIVATGLFSIWTKHIDAKQKVNEHKFSTRSVYVAEKIKAGQVFIGKNNVAIHRLNYEIGFLNYISEGKVAPQSTIDNTLRSRAAQTSFTLEPNDFTDLFFNINGLNKHHSGIAKQADVLTRKFNSFSIESEIAEIKQTVNDLINLYDQLITSLETMNDCVREDLAKYDVL